MDAKPGTEVFVRWVFLREDSEVLVTEGSYRTRGGGTDVTEFFAAKPTPWPAGTYELQVGLDDKVQGVGDVHGRTVTRSVPVAS